MPGDVVLTINGAPVKPVDQMQGLLGKRHRNVALLILARG